MSLEPEANPGFQRDGKKALAVLLSAAIALTALPVVQIPAAAEEPPGSMMQESGYVAGKDGFHVVAYDKSARIEIPFVSGEENYKVYLSQTPDLTDFSGASCVLSSDTYQSYTYAINGDKNAANDLKAISIGYSEIHCSLIYLPLKIIIKCTQRNSHGK